MYADLEFSSVDGNRQDAFKPDVVYREVAGENDPGGILLYTNWAIQHKPPNKGHLSGAGFWLLLIIFRCCQ